MRRKLKGYFMLFRILPVLVWSFTGSLVGTSLAALILHEIKWLPYLLVLSVSALVQGYPTHILNEIFDWLSGADRKELGPKKSGGSKVLQAKLLTLRDLWMIFVIANLILVALVATCAFVINRQIVLLFIVPGYLSGILYSLPPFRFAYRPFLGEWLGGFAGMFLLVTGSYYAQTYTVDPLILLSAFGIGLIYVGIMIFFHYLDFENDQRARPKKNTTVVFLGLRKSRNYVNVCLLISCLVLLASTLEFRLQLLPLLLLGMTLLFCHNKIDLWDHGSIIRWGKVVTYASLLAGLSFAGLSNPGLLLMSIPALIAFWAHKKFGKLTGLRMQVS
ncbi:MAG: prenyltransferase [bacterium]